MCVTIYMIFTKSGRVRTAAALLFLTEATIMNALFVCDLQRVLGMFFSQGRVFSGNTVTDKYFSKGNLRSCT